VAQDFARLFMVPGMDHCGASNIGPGPADIGIDPLTALEKWIAAHYKGSGDPTDATSFTCMDP
jgi:hypothetical protein